MSICTLKYLNIYIYIPDLGLLSILISYLSLSLMNPLEVNFRINIENNDA